MNIKELTSAIRECGQCYRIVAKESGVSRSLIEKIGSGEHVNPTIFTLAIIEHGLEKIAKKARRVKEREILSLRQGETGPGAVCGRSLGPEILEKKGNGCELPESI